MAWNWQISGWSECRYDEAALAPQASQFRGRPVRKKASERRKRSAQVQFRFGIAGATTNARRLDPEPAEECVEHLRPIIMYGTDLAAVRADPAGFGNFLDLVEQDGILQLSEDRLRFLKQQPVSLRPRAPKRAGQATKTWRLRRSILKCRFNDDAHCHGSSPFIEPPTYTDTPKFCPLPFNQDARKPSHLGVSQSALAKKCLLNLFLCARLYVLVRFAIRAVPVLEVGLGGPCWNQLDA